jgi:uncharacterized protein YbaR (Trm112 family)
MNGKIDPELLRILVCPKCHGPLELQCDAQGLEAGLDCSTCQLSYPIEDGIPVMLLEEATKTGGSDVA